ncbi:MAG TPA: hypothetical protein VNB29_05940, partial [Chthoniobacterales bacterium]|nr:hypothetical protein [Chthoniobacterales bacterium]
PVVVSVLISTAICVALLLVTRQRLFRQFSDIQRRLLALERSIQALNLKHENDTTPEQLKRLHLGLVRLQENAAERFGIQAAQSRRSVSEFQVAGLGEWAASLGVSVAPGRIENLAHVVELAERLQSEPVPIGTSDLLAGIIGISAQPERRPSVGLVGESAKSLSDLLPQLVPVFLDGLEIRPFDPSAPEAFDVVLLGGSAAALPPVKKNGVLIVQVAPGTDGAATEFPGFELLAGEWNTRVFRRIED